MKEGEEERRGGGRTQRVATRAAPPPLTLTARERPVVPRRGEGVWLRECEEADALAEASELTVGVEENPLRELDEALHVGLPLPPRPTALGAVVGAVV